MRTIDVGCGEEELQRTVEWRGKAGREDVLRRPVAPQIGALECARQLVTAIDERAGIRRDVIVRLIQCDQRVGVGAGDGRLVATLLTMFLYSWGVERVNPNIHPPTVIGDKERDSFIEVY